MYRCALVSAMTLSLGLLPHFHVYSADSNLELPSLAASMAKPTEQAEKMEHIAITGSRIFREEMTSSAPITVFTAEDIEKIGATSVDVLLQRMSALLLGCPYSQYPVLLLCGIVPL
ncbi:TonB-dependent receptor [Shewanella piezotolerans WP3]|uniref:TonB-dependent receptor n=1 Tax=Shewanella piezotolerans (strain WP3 / JCM 13877) TaxID=225849 RepID=B8CHX3_SHEPW|nr:TonB-dependent receptor [Shewanella piezotolerans]ACJ27249.1 TonB-dependent receptor [Shewanella piezotolerans WP3]